MAALVGPCDLPALGTIAPPCVAAKAAEVTAAAAQGVAATIDFASDPLGYIAQKEASTATALTESVLPALARITQPDLTSEWFLTAYKISFGAAVLGWLMILLYDLATHRGRGESGSEVVDSLLKYTPMFIVGSMFGPAVGAVAVRLVAALNASLIEWGLTSSATEMVDQITGMVDGDPNEVLGGSIVAIVIFGLLLFALGAALVMLLVLMVTLYLSGIALPLSLMWLTKVGQRDKGSKVLFVWGGVLLSQPLMFLLIGAVFAGVTQEAFRGLAGTAGVNEDKLQSLVTLAALVIGMLMATLGPASLLAFAPILPSAGAGTGPRMSGGGGKGGGARTKPLNGGAGPSTPSNGQLSQIAMKNASAGSASKGAGALSGGGGAAGGAGAAAKGAGGVATGGALLAVEAGRQGAQGLADKVKAMREQSQEATQGGSGSATGSGADSSSQNGSGSGAAGGAKEKEKVGAGAKSGSGKGAQAGQSMLGAAGKISELAQSAGDHAASQMDHQHKDPRRGRQ